MSSHLLRLPSNSLVGEITSSDIVTWSPFLRHVLSIIVTFSPFTRRNQALTAVVLHSPGLALC